jgi:hypothetical protein
LVHTETETSDLRSKPGSRHDETAPDGRSYRERERGIGKKRKGKTRSGPRFPNFPISGASTCTST